MTKRELISFLKKMGACKRAIYEIRRQRTKDPVEIFQNKIDIAKEWLRQNENRVDVVLMDPFKNNRCCSAPYPTTRGAGVAGDLRWLLNQDPALIERLLPGASLYGPSGLAAALCAVEEMGLATYLAALRADRGRRRP